MRAANPHGAVSEVWLNRRLSLTAAIASADDHDGLNNLLVRARATPATLREAMEELGLSSLPPPTGIGLDGPLTPKPLGQFFDWVATRIPRQLLQDHSTILRTRILAHLRAQGALSGPSLALVDIGYAGNIQRALARMMMIEGMSLPIWAAYAVTTPGLLWTLRQDHCTATGFLTHLGSPTWLANPFVRSRELFEAFCGAPLGPLLDYDEDGAPRLEKTILSTEQLEELARLQKGALDCCLSTEPPLSQESARMAMLALIAAPRPEEAAAIGRWLYDDPLAIGKPRRLIERIDSDPRPILWPQGALAAEKR